jgi:hypothetical protein
MPTAISNGCQSGMPTAYATAARLTGPAPRQYCGMRFEYQLSRALRRVRSVARADDLITLAVGIERSARRA